VGDVRIEMKMLIYFPAELRKRVGAVIPSGVERFVGAIGLKLPDELEVPLAAYCSNSLETTMDEGFVRERLSWRIREIDGIEGVGAVSANLLAEYGGW